MRYLSKIFQKDEIDIGQYINRATKYRYRAVRGQKTYPQRHRRALFEADQAGRVAPVSCIDDARIVNQIGKGSNVAEALKKPRPEYRNIGIGQLAKYRLPLAGKVSILHRVSGLLLFVCLPFILYLLDQSLTSEISFDAFKGFLANPIVKIVTLVLSWAYLHHFCAGIRFLLLDTHVAVNKEGGRQTALIVLIVSLLLTLAMALKIFGVF
jgi:succinate dehydrogenase / fumarate reductase cytochrome b subunit